MIHECWSWVRSDNLKDEMVCKDCGKLMEYWNCPVCGNDDFYFSRVWPMGDFCTECGTEVV